MLSMSKGIMFNERNGDLDVIFNDSTDVEFCYRLLQVKINSEDFLKICETLQRIGLYSSKDKTLWQSVHLLHKKGFYYLVHFKQLFALDGRVVDFSEEDFVRMRVVAGLLLKWNLIHVDDESTQNELLSLVGDDTILPVRLRIIPFSRKRDFNLKSKYSIGKSLTNT